MDHMLWTPRTTRTTWWNRIRLSLGLGVFSSLLLAPASQAVVVFSDQFEYDASRSATNVQTVFQAHGWRDVKAKNSHFARGNGFLYTQFNTTRQSRTLVIEALPRTENVIQTDFWVMYGGLDRPLGTIPANVWFQFWFYATPHSLFGTQSKFLYPCYTFYPCPAPTYHWLFMWHTVCGTAREGNVVNARAGEWFWYFRSAFADNHAAYSWDNNKLYQNLGCVPMRRDQWYQVRIHIDTSGEQGVYELWVREPGQSTWTKRAEWIGGVTPNFDWLIPVEHRTGDRVLAIPTTINTEDATIYLDDFIMATSVADLEGGSSSGIGGDTTPPASPRNVQVVP